MSPQGPPALRLEKGGKSGGKGGKRANGGKGGKGIPVLTGPTQRGREHLRARDTKASAGSAARHNNAYAARRTTMGTRLDDDADAQDVDVGGVWYIGSVHLCEIVEGGSQAELAARTLLPPPRACSARSVGAMGLESVILRSTSSPGAGPHGALTSREYQGG